METLADYFTRTKDAKQRSLRRLGHHASEPAETVTETVPSPSVTPLASDEQPEELLSKPTPWKASYGNTC